MIIVSDVCDTLYFSNTTMDYVFYVLKQEGRKGSLNLIYSISSKKSPLFYSLILISKIIKVDLIKVMTVKMLKGISKETLDRYAQSFVKEELSGRKIEKTFSLLNQFSGARWILLSSSLDPVVSAVAATLKSEYASSQLEYKQGICTGKLIFEMKGKKHEVLEDKFGTFSEELLVISDNISDRELILKADKRYAVVYKDKFKSFWKKMNATIIEVHE